LIYIAITKYLLKTTPNADRLAALVAQIIIIVIVIIQEIQPQITVLLFMFKDGGENCIFKSFIQFVRFFKYFNAFFFKFILIF